MGACISVPRPQVRFVDYPIDGAEVVAVSDFTAFLPNMMSIAAGDRLDVLDSAEDNFFVRRRCDRQTGYVPMSHVFRPLPVEDEEYFSDCPNRDVAASIVMSPKLSRGAYLLRRQENSVSNYVLTVRDCINERAPLVKHYMIVPKGSQSCININKREHEFPSIPAIIRNFENDQGALCCRLTFPAPLLEKQYIIDSSDLTLDRILGSGHFGEVRHGTWRGTTEVAVKSLKDNRREEVEAFRREAGLMKECNHPNLVSFYGICTSAEGNTLIVTEFVANGWLYEYLMKTARTISLRTMIDISTQVANGMAYLTDLAILHRDLAARNVLVGDDSPRGTQIKITDFGLARKLNVNEVYRWNNSALPMRWVAPEVFGVGGGFTLANDIWSYGILLFEIFAHGDEPYRDIRAEEVVTRVVDGYRMQKPRDCPQMIFDDIMAKCWDDRPEMRPNFHEIHRYFDDVDVTLVPTVLVAEEESLIDLNGYLHSSPVASANA